MLLDNVPGRNFPSNVRLQIFLRKKIKDVEINCNTVSPNLIPAKRTGGPGFEDIKARLADSMMHSAHQNRNVLKSIKGREADIALGKSLTEMRLDPAHIEFILNSDYND